MIIVYIASDIDLSQNKTAPEAVSSTKISEHFECKIVIIILSIMLNVCFGCSKEPSHRDGSFEFRQLMFWLRNKKNNFLIMPPYLEACRVVSCENLLKLK